MGLPSLTAIPHTQSTFPDGEETIPEEIVAEVGTTKTVGAGAVGAEEAATELEVDDETVGAVHRRAEIAMTEQLEVVDETMKVAHRHGEGGGGAGRRGEAAAMVRELEDDRVDVGVVETAKPKRAAIFHVAIMQPRVIWTCAYNPTRFCFLHHGGIRLPRRTSPVQCCLRHQHLQA